jgi:hypothetical protein
MVALKINNFGGMIPAMDEHLLPQNQGALVENAWVYSGALEGFRQLTPVYDIVGTRIRKVFRVPINSPGKDNIPDSAWLEFESRDVDVIQSPTVNDQYERFYWAGQGITTEYNTKARILAGSSAYTLGIPSPATLPGCSVAGGAPPTETRAYVYTWESSFGEEGPPSPPRTVTGNADGTWNLTFTAPTGPNTAGRTLTYTNIYRTISGTSGSTAYFFVAKIAIGTLTYADTIATTVVSGNQILQSLFWSGPPTGLRGMVSMPNGIVAGFTQSEIWFTEPYRPHAWPPIYTLAVEAPIVGLGVIGQSLIVCTSGSPYAVSGINPGTMALSKIAANEPCTSRGSIASGPSGVAYTSPNGVVLATPGMAQVVTRDLITKDIWSDPAEGLQLPATYAAGLNGAYYVWGAAQLGCFEPTAFDNDNFLMEDLTGSYSGAIVDANNPRAAYVRLTSTTSVYNCFSDVWTGEVFLIKDDIVYWVDVSQARPHGSFKWRSKIFEAPNQRNFGAMRIWHAPFAETPALNPVPNANLVQTLAADQWGLVRVYADGILRYTRELRTSGEIMRLPSGFKAQFWEVEIEARIKITSFEIATSVKELGGV